MDCILKQQIQNIYCTILTNYRDLKKSILFNLTQIINLVINRDRGGAANIQNHFSKVPDKRTSSQRGSFVFHSSKKEEEEKKQLKALSKGV